MYELKNDPFYDVIAKYQGCVIDFCIMKSDTFYREEASHREAVLYAIQKFSLQYGDDGQMWEWDESRAFAKEIDAKAFLSLPEKPWKKTLKGKDGTDVICYDKKTDGGSIPYWEAFLMPPYGQSYTEEDFSKVNAALFPNGTDALTVYEWTTDWADYFDEGREWWGTMCVSVYDESLDRYAVIMASATD